jgi:TetR/AcrR family transcriptional regulator, cholesterol catabolism regulator
MDRSLELSPAAADPGAKSRPRRSHSRLPLVLDQAARVFAKHGFAAASIRDIVQPIGMLPGSLYYHFPTKDDLLLAVYEEGVRRISDELDAAVSGLTDPWQRLEAGCVAHLRQLLNESDYSRVVIRISPDEAPAVASRLGALRDRYERRFVKLISALPASGFNATDARLFILGALNWTPTWYRRNGSLRPEQIARRLIKLARRGMDRKESK